MRWFATPILMFSLLAGTPGSAKIPEPEIWFNPHGPVDMVNMWSDAAPWQQAAGKVQVLVVVDWWIRVATNRAQLIQMLDFAKEHHMKIDLDTQSVAKLPNETCGGGEGYSYPGEVAGSIQILVSLGAIVDYVDMDEPLWFGHYSTDPVDCQLSLADTISRTALIMKDAFAAYPMAHLVEIEPIPILTETPAWRSDTTAFRLGLSQQLGVPVSSMQFDVNWDDPAWEQSMLDIHGYLRENNMKLSVILDGTALNVGDTAWINAAISHFDTMEGSLHVIPEQVLFTSWNPNPAYNMPETSPTSQTWLINRYFRPRSQLLVQFVGQGAQGILSTIDGKPIANATINGFKPGADSFKPLPTTVTPGVVPVGAVFGEFAFRVNTECGCNGLNDILIGASGYQETQGGTSQFSFSPANVPGYLVNKPIVSVEIFGGTQVARIITFPGQQALWNSPVFPVTVGAQYQFTVAAGSIGGIGWYGTVNLVWLNANHSEISRVITRPTPGRALVSTTVTAADGTFSLFPMLRSVDGPNPVTVEFDGGGGAYRSSVWSPLQ